MIPQVTVGHSILYGNSTKDETFGFEIVPKPILEEEDGEKWEFV